MADNIKWLSLYLEFDKINDETLKILRNIGKYWETLRNIEKHWATLRHWIHWVGFQYIESQTLNSIQCQCGKIKHWKPLNVDVNVNFFNVSMWNSMFNVDLQTLSVHTVCLFPDVYEMLPKLHCNFLSLLSNCDSNNICQIILVS